MINIAVGKPLPNTTGLHLTNCPLSSEARFHQLDPEWWWQCGWRGTLHAYSAAPHTQLPRETCSRAECGRHRRAQGKL